MSYQYVLFVDEAGDDKTEALKPTNANGNSEWLCLGGYLIKAELESELDSRRDALLREIGGRDGGHLHYRNYKPRNRVKICEKLSTYSARAFVVCSFKKTMVGYRNPRAENSQTDPRQILYNFVVRLLLERVTEFVYEHAQAKKLEKPTLKIVMASRRGHHFGHFGHFKEYVQKLQDQARYGNTFLKKKQIKQDVLQQDLIIRAPARSMAGLQLADAVVSATFQSIEQMSPHYFDHPALKLRRVIAKKRPHPRVPPKAEDYGMTLYPAREVLDLLNDEQWQFFSSFGYDRDFLRKSNRRK
ncbi:DUF3800 domain-containing protein [Cohaesibacter marisflavi]|uniref:DUF3800 domain-containing protein n=1 Tax=Cohaesibacter marisflavi TaxID=655353 RepID=UPI0029C9658B|nr:DUF3800 domain-containing protein [Cohaesibacter marisflavi]